MIFEWCSCGGTHYSVEHDEHTAAEAVKKFKAKLGARKRRIPKSAPGAPVRLDAVPEEDR